jgi:parallel beta-helix repeat protein
MKVKSFLLTGKAVFALAISASLLIASCSKEDLEYKKRRRTNQTTPTQPTTPEPAPTTPTPTPTTPSGTVKFLSLPSSGAKNISGQSNVVIENLRFENISGNPLYIKGSNNITIRNCFFNKATMEAIVIENSSNVKVENCLFNGVTTGVYALGSQSIKVDNNQFVNVRQRSGGGRGQFVQFNGVSGAGNSVSNNKGENFLGESDPEDLISLFKSSGTASSPIAVRNNMFRGGGPSASGGGIMSGDYGGSYQIVENNTLLDPGQYGIAAAGGSNISLLNNKIFAKQQPFTNNPLYVWAQQGASCSNITVKGNRVTWTDKSGSKNNGWNAGNCGGTSFEYPAAISLSEMNVPSHLITMITPTELSQIRK